MAARALTQPPADIRKEVKLSMLKGIASALRARYDRNLDMTIALGLDHAQVSRLLSYDTTQFSIGYLCELAHRLGLTVTVTVQ